MAAAPGRMLLTCVCIIEAANGSVFTPTGVLLQLVDWTCEHLAVGNLHSGLWLVTPTVLAHPPTLQLTGRRCCCHGNHGASLFVPHDDILLHFPHFKINILRTNTTDPLLAPHN